MPKWEYCQLTFYSDSTQALKGRGLRLYPLTFRSTLRRFFKDLYCKLHYRGEFELYVHSAVNIFKNGIGTWEELDRVQQPGYLSELALHYVDFLEKHCIEYLNHYGEEGWEVIQIERQIKQNPHPYRYDAIKIETYTIKCMLKRQL